MTSAKESLENRSFLKNQSRRCRLVSLVRFTLLGAMAILFSGCATHRSAKLVIVNDRLGYAKVLSREASSTLLKAVSNAPIDPKAQSFDDFHGEGNWGGRMYRVFIRVKADVYVPKFVFDSSGFYVEDQSGSKPVVRTLNWEDGNVVDGLLSPWSSSEEARQADMKAKSELKWGLFP